VNNFLIIYENIVDIKWGKVVKSGVQWGKRAALALL
jgi:hypothetical protein